MPRVANVVFDLVTFKPLAWISFSMLEVFARVLGETLPS